MSVRGSHDAIALQKLAIRLFFSESLQRRWRADPESVVDDFGVPRDWIRYLPTVETPQFKAEVWGRRLLVGSEIHGRFGKALRWMTGEADAIAFARGELLARFLDSEEFFSPRSAIPHPYGMGPGYENVTKFFVWLVADQALARPFEIGKRRRSLAMRRRFYAAYGVHLVTQARHSTTAFYVALRAGVYFSSSPAGKLAWEMIDSELGVTRLNGLAEPILKESGLVDIDFLLTLNNTPTE
jgi:hypothetical protein